MEFSADVSLQTTLGLLVAAFAVTLVIAGLLLLKFRFLDGKRIKISRPAGIFVLLIGVILLLAAVLGIIYINFRG